MCAGNWGLSQEVLFERYITLGYTQSSWSSLRLQVWAHNLDAVTFPIFRVYLGRMAFPGCRADRGGQVLLVPLDSWYVFALTSFVQVPLKRRVSMALKSFSPVLQGPPGIQGDIVSKNAQHPLVLGHTLLLLHRVSILHAPITREGHTTHWLHRWQILDSHQFWDQNLFSYSL